MLPCPPVLARAPRLVASFLLVSGWLALLLLGGAPVFLVHLLLLAALALFPWRELR